MVVVQRQPQLLEIVDALNAPSRFAPDWTAGNKSAIKTAMIAITTNSSINVNAPLRRTISARVVRSSSVVVRVHASSQHQFRWVRWLDMSDPRR